MREYNIRKTDFPLTEENFESICKDVIESAIILIVPPMLTPLGQSIDSKFLYTLCVSEELQYEPSVWYVIFINIKGAVPICYRCEESTCNSKEYWS